MTECYRCGEEGHARRDCPQDAPLPASQSHSDRPTWCGSCDEITRLVYLADSAKRCPACHPLRGRELAQHRKCPACRQRVYTWDVLPCGRHQPIAA